MPVFPLYGGPICCYDLNKVPKNSRNVISGSFFAAKQSLIVDFSKGKIALLTAQ